MKLTLITSTLLLESDYVIQITCNQFYKFAEFHHVIFIYFTQAEIGYYFYGNLFPPLVKKYF